MAWWKFWENWGTQPSVSGAPKLTSSRIPKDAVLLFGGTGRAGQSILKCLLDAGTDVVVASRSLDKLKASFPTEQEEFPTLFLKSGIDVTDPSTITENLFEGVSQVVSCIGPVFNETKMTSENVDFYGNIAIIEKAASFLKPAAETTTTLVNFSKPLKTFEKWERLDDTIMGGRSSSGWSEVDWQNEGKDFNRWSGDVIKQGGGFCGTVLNNCEFDMSQFDGLQVRLRGDGNTYKFRLKSAEATLYQAVFETTAGQWTEVRLPFDAFVPVVRTQSLYSAPSLRSLPSEVKGWSVGFILSRFEFNETPNPKLVAPSFRLDVATISLYRAPRPSLVLISSAGAERINRLETAEQRAADIPIVQLNPQGILNWKYKAEQGLRASGIPYTIIRPTGVVGGAGVAGEGPRRVEARQGDCIAGRITRSELARVVLGALQSPNAVGKTLEVRRDETDSGLLEANNWGPGGRGRVVQGQDADSLFRPLVRDDERVSRGGMLPFPPARLPAAEVTEERRREILADPRVQAVQARDRAEAEVVTAQSD